MVLNRYFSNLLTTYTTFPPLQIQTIQAKIMMSSRYLSNPGKMCQYYLDYHIFIYRLTKSNFHKDYYFFLPSRIVSVKDCFTGEMINTRALIKFPEDAASPHSWYDR